MSSTLLSGTLFPLRGVAPMSLINEVLRRRHYLGPTARGIGWMDDYGVLVLAAPTSRRLPTDWLELTRWCLYGIKNGGSRQWACVARWLRAHTECSTVISYSDPSQGHTGALYRASGWRWAPTWHRLREPPTGNGSWTAGVQQSVKDRWVFCLSTDSRRASALSLGDEGLRRRIPWAEYQEGAGGDYKRFISSCATRRA